MNVDVKITSKILAKRMETLMQKLFSEERSVGRWGTQLISDMLQETNSQNLPGILFATDFEAAFDSIDFCILFQVFEKYCFNKGFIKWIRFHTVKVT